MAYCPRCRFEYRETARRCPDCGTALRPGSPPSPPAVPGDETRPVRVRTLDDPTAGEILRALLIEHGIPAIVQRHGPITGELGRVTDGLTDDRAILMVPANRVEEAEALLTEVESGPVVWPEGMEPEE